MKIMYAITHVNKAGRRTLTFTNEWKHHYYSVEAAQAALKGLRTSILEGALRGMADSLAIRQVECHDNGEAVDIYFDH